MGVKGLWRLLLPIGRRISLETLEGRTLAVDASIWLTQFLKAMRDPATGKVQPAAHLTGFVRRLCRLYFHGIRAVFVFDGPTPAIKLREIADRRKRREQFAKLDQAALQRMAKRLLAENLKKSKRITVPRKQAPSSGENAREQAGTATYAAFVEGFHPGGEIQQYKQQNNKEADPSNIAESFPADSTSIGIESKQRPAGVEGERKATSAEDEAAILAAIQEDMINADQQKQEEDEDQNDFDAPIHSDSDQEHGTNMDKDLRHFSRKNNNRSKRRRSRGRDKRMETNDSVDYEDAGRISMLPSVERKDAIEEAKRQQRLQSRREYMPAAASPDKFSNVQLQNFLKSSHFNLDIQRMATEQVESAAEAKKVDKSTDANGRQGGRKDESFVMASDRTTRISLVREENTTRSGLQKMADQSSSLFAKPPLQDRSSKASLKQSKNLSESELESDVEWEDADVRPTQRAIVESSDEENTKSRPHRKNEQLSVTFSNDGAHLEGLGEDEGGGGFLPMDTAKRESRGSFLSDDHDPGHPAAKSDGSGKCNFIVLNDDSTAGTNASSRGGGFLVPDDQEQQDMALAQALQEIEDGNAAMQQFDTSSFGSHNSTKAVQGDDDVVSKVVGGNAEWEAIEVESAEDDRKPAAKVSTDNARIVNIDDSSDNESSIDWQDGEINPESKQTVDSMVHDDEHAKDTVAPATSEPNPLDAHNLEGKTSAVTESYCEGGMCDLQGGSRRNDNSPNSQPSRLMSKPRASASEGSKVAVPGTFDDELVENEFIENTFTDNHEFLSEARYGGDMESSETKAVLQRAQATASTMADWAGRAFRRAVREIGNIGGNQAHEAEEKELNAKKEEAVPHVLVPDISDVQAAPYSRPSPGISVAETTHRDGAGPWKPRPTVKSRDEQPNLRSALEQEDLVRRASLEITDDLLKQWESERNQRERDGDMVTDEMREEAMRLLRLFGVPYIEAPAEAEAQCVALEDLGLVDGIVTEDSDVFVFGGKKVYKNIFEEKLYAEAYMADDAEKEMGIDRNGLVALAMLLGSDYTYVCLTIQIWAGYASSSQQYLFSTF